MSHTYKYVTFFMEERTPIKKLSENETINPNKEAWVVEVGSQTVEETIQEMRDKKSLSLMFGFEGDDFDGAEEKAANIWDWVKSRYPDSNEALAFTKSIIKMLGASEVKKPLVTKVYQWVNLQNSIDDLKDRQDLLNGNR